MAMPDTVYNLPTHPTHLMSGSAGLSPLLLLVLSADVLFSRPGSIVAPGAPAANPCSSTEREGRAGRAGR